MIKKIPVDKSKTDRKKEINEYKAKLHEYLAGWQRAQADYQNLKKEVSQEKSQMVDFARSEILQDFFPLLDNFRLALKHVPSEQQSEGWYQGFVHLLNQFDTVLAGYEVSRIETLGKEFDVGTMEAIDKIKSNKYKSGNVLKEVRAGYIMKDKVIVPAQVIVAE